MSTSRSMRTLLLAAMPLCGACNGIPDESSTPETSDVDEAREALSRQTATIPPGQSHKFGGNVIDETNILVDNLGDTRCSVEYRYANLPPPWDRDFYWIEPHDAIFNKPRLWGSPLEIINQSSDDTLYAQVW